MQEAYLHSAVSRWRRSRFEFLGTFCAGVWEDDGVIESGTDSTDTAHGFT